MPSKKQYDLVQNDDYDNRVPLHPEEAFHHGILFHVKVSHAHKASHKTFRYLLKCGFHLLLSVGSVKR